LPPAITRGAGRGTSSQRLNAAELSEIGVVTVDADLVSCHVLPPDATAQTQASGPRRKAVIASRIQAARSYAETARCGRSELLAYFGDHYNPPCGRCDNDAATRTTGRAASHTDRPGPGRRVHHRLWGDGTLLDQDDYELIIVCDAIGYRTLTRAALANGLLTEL
jgi:ATP-dependent DNA helicase RecQ